MDKGYRFLHNHPMAEKNLGLDEQHVIVDRDAWEEARKRVLNLGIPFVSGSALPDGFKVYKCTDCGATNVKRDNGEVRVGFCDECEHPLWN